jgi:predicted ATPase
MLVGRSVECATLERLLADARQGRSGVLLVRGEPGIGKSTLLHHTIEQAKGSPLSKRRAWSPKRS